MIDIHCHILFGVDDGPQSAEDAIALAKALVTDGVSRVVATPHILDPPLSPRQVAVGLQGLAGLYAEHGISLQAFPGGENHYTLSVEEMSAHTINGGRYLLLEFPHQFFPAHAGDIVFQLRSHGLVPIIAHPERNAGLLHNPELLHELVAQGALCQLTAASLLGDFGSPVRQLSRYLLKKRWVHFLATDAHGANWRSPRLSAGVQEAARLLGREEAMRLVEANPECVLEDRAWVDD